MGSKLAATDNEKGLPMISEHDFKTICLGAGIRKEALADAFLDYEENGGDKHVTEWIESARKPSPHWFDTITDGTEAALFNVTAQGEYVEKHGEDAAHKFLAGHGLKLGEVKKPTRTDAAKVKGANNPWAKEFSGTEAEREAKMASIIRQGTKFAASMAASAGKTITGAPLRR